VAIRDERDFNIIWHVNRDKDILYDDLQPGRYMLKVTFIKPSLEANTYKIVFGMQDAETLEYFNKSTSKEQNVFKVVGNRIPRGTILCESQWELKRL